MNQPASPPSDSAQESLPSSSCLDEQAWDPLRLTHEGILLLDAAGIVTAANARALELLHCTLPALSGHSFWAAIPPEVAAQHQDITEQVLLNSDRHVFIAHQRAQKSSVEYTFRRHLPGYVVNLREAASVQRLQCLLEDSKRYNELIFEANPNAMWVFDLASLRIFAVNQAAVKFYEIPRKVFMTLGMEALFPEGEGAELLHSLRPGKTNGGALPELRLCKQRKMNGQQILVELAWSPVNWDGHQAVLVSLADISQRHLADSALKRANAELQQALAVQQSELKKTRNDLLAFTQAVSSDLQDSLHVANGFAAVLAEKYSAVLDGPGRHYVRRIQASIYLLAKLVDDLRTLAQLPLQTGAAGMMDLAPVCQSLIANLRKRDPGREVSIEMESRLLLVGNKALLVTAMTCLLENAWKFTSKKTEAWIKIGLLPGQVAGEIVLQVSDNGAGFDTSYSGNLFTAFQRLHSSADFSGNGLGLAIVKRVAELHGGRAWAESSGQTGASFFMALPQGPVSAAQASTLPETAVS